VAALEWPPIEASLDERGYARTPRVLTDDECRALAALEGDDRRFRSRVDMERFGFGVGRYAYFSRPLPRVVEELRRNLYVHLVPIANRWMEALGEERRFPRSLEKFLAECAAAGQSKPTPLLLRYEPDGYNCLHRDLYGDVAFPLQVTAFLSAPEVDYAGGEFLLVEQRPRAQSRGEALLPGRGELMIFPNAVRPLRGRRGFYRAGVRHGVSRIRSGERLTLGIIFHDAR
jgi:hypothetical protein